MPQRWGVGRAALGTRSEAARVFAAALLQEVSSELARRAWTQAPQGKRAEGDRERELGGDLGAIAGSLLPALPRRGWAVGQEEPHRAAKRPRAFAALRQVPVGVRVTAGNSSERAQARQVVQPGGFYGWDRGDGEDELLAEWPALPCRFSGRVQDHAADEVAQARPLSAAARAVGVTRDVGLQRLGTAHPRPCAAQPRRVVRVVTAKLHKDGTPVELGLGTTRGDLAADLIAGAYRYRWTVELFFRWLQCLLGCRHLLRHSENGVPLQVSMALVASFLISLWGGRSPTKRTSEVLCCYLSGWASTREVLTHVERFQLQAPPGKK